MENGISLFNFIFSGMTHIETKNKNKGGSKWGQRGPCPPPGSSGIYGALHFGTQNHEKTPFWPFRLSDTMFKILILKFSQTFRFGTSIFLVFSCFRK